MEANKFGLIPFRSPLLRDSRLMSFPLGTEMFQFPRCPPHNLCIQLWVPRHDSRWVSPFGYRRIKAWLAAPRRLSQPPTSFIGTVRQGIPHVLFVTLSLLLEMTDTLERANRLVDICLIKTDIENHIILPFTLLLCVHHACE